jgi:hypothetical protein
LQFGSLIPGECVRLISAEQNVLGLLHMTENGYNEKYV